MTALGYKSRAVGTAWIQRCRAKHRILLYEFNQNCEESIDETWGCDSDDESAEALQSVLEHEARRREHIMSTL
eukprot:4490083-Amphidinium_carterae.1